MVVWFEPPTAAAEQAVVGLIADLEKPAGPAQVRKRTECACKRRAVQCTRLKPLDTCASLEPLGLVYGCQPSAGKLLPAFDLEYALMQPSLPFSPARFPCEAE